MKKSNFGLFFKKLPDDYLFESMIIFCIFFWTIPIFYFPRDIKFDLSSVPAQCAYDGAYPRPSTALSESVLGKGRIVLHIGITGIRCTEHVPF